MKAGIVYRNGKNAREIAEDVKDFLESMEVHIKLFSEPIPLLVLAETELF